MKKWFAVFVVGVLAFGAMVPCASAALISEDPGEFDISAQYWIPGDGDFDLYENGYGVELSYREWFRFPWGVGVSAGVAQWGVDGGSDAFKIDYWSHYDGDILYIPLGLSLYFCLIDWEDWNLVLDAGVRYVIIDSDVKVMDNNLGRKRDVDIDNGIVGNVGIEFQYKTTEDIFLNAGLGYQMSLMKGDADSEGDDLRNNSLQGAYVRIGVKYLF